MNKLADAVDAEINIFVTQLANAEEETVSKDQPENVRVSKISTLE